MPAVSQKQQEFFGAELRRREMGEARRVTGMSTADVRKYAGTKHKGLPVRVKPKKR